jgi:hypothetical protein
MLGKALCLLLILQCVSAGGHNSIEEIFDRIGEYAESLGKNFDFSAQQIMNIKQSKNQT